MILSPGPSTRAHFARAEPLPGQSIMPPLRGPADSPATLRGSGSYRVKAPFRLSSLPAQEEPMAVKLSQRGWTAARHPAPCVLCRQPAILRSPRGKPCHWTCALAWVTGHQDQDHARRRARCTLADPCYQDSCPACYPDRFMHEAQDDQHAGQPVGSSPGQSLEDRSEW
jgi:hypothetical protein